MHAHLTLFKLPFDNLPLSVREGALPAVYLDGSTAVNYATVIYITPYSCTQSHADYVRVQVFIKVNGGKMSFD